MFCGFEKYMLMLLTAASCAVLNAVPPVEPFEDSVSPIAGTKTTDQLLEADWKVNSIIPSNRCSDSVFIRRASIDLTGMLPAPEEVTAFLEDKSPDKRAKLIDNLLERDSFVDYQSMKWCDVLRVKSEFPINLWPNAVQTYHRWIRDAVKSNMPLDRFARELLTSNGSNFRNPTANFFRASADRSPSGLAKAVCLTFLCRRWDSLSPQEQADMAKIFSRIAFKNTMEWKEEVVYSKTDDMEPFSVVLPGKAKIKVKRGEDPRAVFADWLINSEKPQDSSFFSMLFGRDPESGFSKAMVNRAWHWLFGRGLAESADDMRPDNPPVNARLLDYLSAEFIKSGYDFKALCRMIMNSAAYQMSSVRADNDANAVRHFAAYPVTRLDAEVIIDAICDLTGSKEEYVSVIPEPFTFIPRDSRTTALSDGSISSSFLENFGRPDRDSGLFSERNNSITANQRLYLLNSGDLLRRAANSNRVRNINRDKKLGPEKKIEALYLNVLSRYPTKAEMDSILAYRKAMNIDITQAVSDTFWVLINSKEFLYRH